jgi:large subunit ribosomal protein L22
MIISARVKNVRISDKKVFPVLKFIRNMHVERAIDILTFSNKKAAFFVRKLLKSVISNAEHNNGIDIDNLFIYRIYATSGSSLKRFKIRAKGRSNRILKRSCHIYIEVKEKI